MSVHACSQLISHPVSQPTSQPVSQEVSHPVSQPASQVVSQLTDWQPSDSQPTSHDVWHPSSHPEVHDCSQQTVHPAASHDDVQPSWQSRVQLMTQMVWQSPEHEIVNATVHPSWHESTRHESS